MQTRDPGMSLTPFSTYLHDIVSFSPQQGLKKWHLGFKREKYTPGHSEALELAEDRVVLPGLGEHLGIHGAAGQKIVRSFLKTLSPSLGPPDTMSPKTWPLLHLGPLSFKRISTSFAGNATYHFASSYCG